MIFSIKVTIAVLWLLSAGFDYSAFSYIWQLKEYRLDRFKDFFHTKQGREFFTQYRIIWRALIALSLYVAVEGNGAASLVVLLLLDFFYNIRSVITGSFRRPDITGRSALLLLLAVLFEAIVLLMARTVNIILLLLLFRFFTMTIVVFCTAIPVKATKNMIIWYAGRKIQRNSHLRVIGITGSFGKTTVKEFVSHLLSQKYRTLKTPGNTNTDIGVARFLLKSDLKNIDVLVIEMGAYRVGEIKKICRMVRPQIGILTSIAEQHLSLFGSIENIQTTKYELLRSIPSTGYVITNADNPYCLSLLSTLNCKKIETFGTDPDRKPDYLIKDIKGSPEHIDCEVIYAGLPLRLSAPVRGSHQALNIAPAVMVAGHMGISDEEIRKALLSLPRDLKTSISIYPYGAAIIIDDSYNANPDGFRAALDILSMYPSTRKRIVITRGMMELGERSGEIHERIGEEITFCADELVVITSDFFEPLKRGVDSIKHKYNLELKSIYDPKELLSYLQSFKQSSSVILLENRMPQAIYNELTLHRPKRDKDL